MKKFLISLILSSSAFASTMIETNEKCIEGLLYLQTVVVQTTQYQRVEPISASLVQVFKLNDAKDKVVPAKCKIINKNIIH